MELQFLKNIYIIIKIRLLHQEKKRKKTKKKQKNKQKIEKSNNW